MELISDLHIHSRYSAACSKNIDLEKLEQYAKVKGVNLLGTGDFTHPKWIEEIKEKLKEDDKGILWSNTKFPFILTSEISLIYSKGGKGRRIHYVFLAPSLDVVKQITDELLKKGRIDYDGRPIFGVDSIELVDIFRSISKDIEIIPAHIWTSWFSIFGSKSGFDTVEECFEDRAKYIHALETGMSSDPPLNWRLSKLDKYNLVSFSDSHSFWPWRLGREATVFDCELSYKNILNAIRTGKGLKSTIETVPDYGKYHFDGHRKCDVCLHPKQTIKLNGICPKCGKALTIGVAYRVEELADREEGFKPENAKPYYDLIPLTELICKIYNVKMLSSKKVWEIYNKLIEKFDNEYNILLKVSAEELAKVVDTDLVKLIIKGRNNKLNISPGYDGEYGEVLLDDKMKFEEQEYKPKQKSLGDF